MRGSTGAAGAPASLDRADVAGGTLRARDATLIGAGEAGRDRVDGRTAGGGHTRVGWAAVVRERREQRVLSGAVARAPRPQVVPGSRLKPPLAGAWPAQLPTMLPATDTAGAAGSVNRSSTPVPLPVSVTDLSSAGPAATWMPLPLPAVLPDTVTFVSFSEPPEPPLKIAPPSPAASRRTRPPCCS